MSTLHVSTTRSTRFTRSTVALVVLLVVANFSMSPASTATFVVLLVAALGALARTLVPYLETLRDAPDTAFDRKFLVPPLVSCVIALITLPLALSALPKDLIESPTLSVSGLVAVFLAVWGATDMARSGQKLIGTLFMPGR